MQVTTATGADARHFVEMKAQYDKKYARHRAVVAQKLAKKGWKPANVFAVVTQQREQVPGGWRPALHDLWGKIMPALRAQTVYSDGEGPFEGVVIYESWDDGDDTTWEGMSYFENYDTGQAFSASSQEWTGADYEHVFWADGGGYDPPGDDPPPAIARWLPPGSGLRQRVTVAALRADPDSRCAATPANASFSASPTSSMMYGTVQDPGTATSCPCPRNGWEEPIASCALKVGITRSWVWCGTVFGGCRWAGSLWKACGIGCAARALSETLVEGYRWHRDCVR